MTTVIKRVVTTEDTTPVGILSIHKITEWLNHAVIIYNKTKPHHINSFKAKMASIEFHKPVFLDDVLIFKCDNICQDHSHSVLVKVLSNNTTVIESTYTHCH